MVPLAVFDFGGGSREAGVAAFGAEEFTEVGSGVGVGVAVGCAAAVVDFLLPLALLLSGAVDDLFFGLFFFFDDFGVSISAVESAAGGAAALPSKCC